MRTVLLLGATGRTGRRVLAELLSRDIATRVIVRSEARLPDGLVGHPRLRVHEADLLDLPSDELARQLAPCDVVISCLGHTLSLSGIFGPPHDLVERALANVVAAAGTGEQPLRLILLSSVSVNRPDHGDRRRGAGERLVLALLRTVVPPARDNQRAADLLVRTIGSDRDRFEGVVVRPDSLIEEGDATAFELHDELVSGLFRPRHTRMANIARFMVDLVSDDASWARWRGGMPVIVDGEPAAPEGEAAQEG
jgi:nucleoside-diphosphate-sugar epimerase